jgi:hypothetical protein
MNGIQINQLYVVYAIAFARTRSGGQIERGEATESPTMAAAMALGVADGKVGTASLRSMNDLQQALSKLGFSL